MRKLDLGLGTLENPTRPPHIGSGIMTNIRFYAER